MKYYPGRHEFMDLIGPALGHKSEAVLSLGEWCDNHGNTLWNGETYDVSRPCEPSGTHSLRPIYRWDEKLDQGEVIGYALDGWEAYYNA